MPPVPSRSALVPPPAGAAPVAGAAVAAGAAGATAVSASLQRAYLRILQPTDRGGGARIDQIDFQFNPREYVIQKAARWKRNTARNARHASMPEFEGAEPASVSLELRLDATVAAPDAAGRRESSPAALRRKVELLLSCVRPVDGGGEGRHASAPMVLFGWGGSAVILTAVVTQVSVRYTLFLPDGTPVRAVCAVELEEVPTDPPFQNPTSGGLRPQRSHTVVAGDSLASVATLVYGQPRCWRAIAAANDLDDPMRVPVGSVLLLPSEADAAALS